MRTDDTSHTHIGVAFPEAGQTTTDAGRLIFVTNRGPIEYNLGPDGTPQAKRGAGGVVSGLLCAASERPISWISVAMNEADRQVAQAHADSAVAAPAGLINLTSRLVYVPETTYHRYYDRVSNRMLWFAQHGMLLNEATPASEIVADWDNGYVMVNEALADAVIAELQSSGEAVPVMFHDYHLYLAPAMVRARMPQARLQHFVHIPWPSPEAWARFPEHIVRQIYAGLAGNDVIGFQTTRDARNFLAGASRYLRGARISRDPDELDWQGRRVLVRAYPIALTPASVEASARSKAAQAQARQLRQRLRLDEGRKLLVRVDRVEPTKNIVRGFDAYERMLSEHPEWHERVVFLALLVPSRESLEEYRRYAAAVKQAIARINTRFGTDRWQPITAIFGNDRARALACMQDYDVLLVNPLIDGMNLVVKEGGLLNRRDGVIVLSEGAGAYAQLRGGVVGIDALDVTGTAEALHAALTMAPEKRAQLMAQVRSVLRAESAELWLRRQLADLMRVTGRTSGIPTWRQPVASATTALQETVRAGIENLAGVSLRLLREARRNTSMRQEPGDVVPVLTRPSDAAKISRESLLLPDAALLAALDGTNVDEGASG